MMASVEESSPEIMESPSPRSEENLMFQNHLILEGIFKFLPLPELCQARLVCRQWHRVSLSFWRALASMRIYSEKRDAAYERKRYMTLDDFIELYERTEDSPMATLRLAGWPYLHFKLLYFRELQSVSRERSLFWNECGPWISSLHLVAFHLPSYREYRDILLSKYTPNVKNFKISYGNYWNMENDLDSENSGGVEPAVGLKPNRNLKTLSFIVTTPELPWAELFSTYPELSKLEISYPVRCLEWEENLRELLRAIRDNRQKDKSTMQLRALRVQRMNQEISLRSPNILYQLISDLSLPLEFLTLDKDLFTDEVPLKTVLSAYQNTLKRFKLCGGYTASDQPPMQVPVLPPLPHLEELIVTANTFHTMDILLYTPNLKLFQVINPWRSRTLTRYTLKGFLTCSESLRLDSLKSLRYDYDLTPTGLFRLVGWMPNLEELQIPLTNETFRMVCQHWPGLKKLVVQRDKVDDDGLVGNCRGDAGLLDMPDFQKCMLISYQAQHSIRDLKELTSFVMENHRYTFDEEDDYLFNRTNDVLPTKLTEKSITHGILHLPKLKQVSISVDERNISEEVVESLKQVVPEVKVARLNNPFWAFGSWTPPD